jgi:hypothetical protein
MAFRLNTWQAAMITRIQREITTGAIDRTTRASFSVSHAVPIRTCWQRADVNIADPSQSRAACHPLLGRQATFAPAIT